MPFQQLVKSLVERFSVREGTMCGGLAFASQSVRLVVGQ